MNCCGHSSFLYPQKREHCFACNDDSNYLGPSQAGTFLHFHLYSSLVLHNLHLNSKLSLIVLLNCICQPIMLYGEDFLLYDVSMNRHFDIHVLWVSANAFAVCKICMVSLIVFEKQWHTDIISIMWRESELIIFIHFMTVAFYHVLTATDSTLHIGRIIHMPHCYRSFEILLAFTFIFRALPTERPWFWFVCAELQLMIKRFYAIYCKNARKFGANYSQSIFPVNYISIIIIVKITCLFHIFVLLHFLLQA